MTGGDKSTLVNDIRYSIFGNSIRKGRERGGRGEGEGRERGGRGEGEGRERGGRGEGEGRERGNYVFQGRLCVCLYILCGAWKLRRFVGSDRMP